jgi:hypothetical protein
MMSKKKLSKIKAEVAALLQTLPGKSPEAWLAKEIEAAKKDPKRDARTLEMLCAALESEAKKQGRTKPRRRPFKR